MITITFTPETPEQLAAVTAAMQAYLGAPAQDERVAEADPVPKPAVRRTRKSADAEASASATGPAETPVAETSEPEAPAAQPASAPVPEVSLEQVRAKLVALSQAGKGPDVAMLLNNKYGVKNLTSVLKEHLPLLMADAEKM